MFGLTDDLIDARTNIRAGRILLRKAHAAKTLKEMRFFIMQADQLFFDGMDMYGKEDEVGADGKHCVASWSKKKGKS
jgi:hypothetical protein